jgi:enoyl-CoA hydratase/carnithine racemase
MGCPGQAPELSPDLLAVMQHQLEALHADERLLLLRGQPEGFCMGMDLEVVANWPTGHSTRELHAGFAALLEALRHHPVTTVALVEGDAMGGGLALAAACDLVVALKSAHFALPELLWGLQPAHALPFVVRRMGMAAGRRLALLTEPIDALQAREQGLVDFVVDDGAKLEGLVRRLTLRAARMPRGAAAQLRKLFDVLEHESSNYPAQALDCITSITDDAAFRHRLGLRYAELLAEVKHE